MNPTARWSRGGKAIEPDHPFRLGPQVMAIGTDDLGANPLTRRRVDQALDLDMTVDFRRIALGAPCGHAIRSDSVNHDIERLTDLGGEFGG